MRGLLVKDLRFLMSQRRFILILLIIAFFLNLNGEGNFAMGYLIFIGSFLVMNTIGNDEFDNGYLFLFTLPVERKTYAVEKYVFGMIAGGAAWLAGLAISLLQSAAGRGMPVGELLRISPIYISFFILLSAVMIPFPLIFGREKGNIVMLITVGAILLAGYVGEKLLAGRGFAVGELLNSLQGNGWEMLELLCFCGALVIFLVSCAAGVAGISRREF